MNDEQSLIDAIRANPEDDDARLVYADWLEERGDVRGEYLRLECQVRKFQARLTQLREQLDPAWLAQVGWLVDVVLQASAPEHKILIIKKVRELTGLGLKEAKDLLEAAPRIVKEGVPWEEAEKVKAYLEERSEYYGDTTVSPATVTLQPCGTKLPPRQSSGVGLRNWEAQLADTKVKRFDIVLRSYPPEQKINLIRYVREWTGLGLKESLDLVGTVPAILFAAVTRTQLEKITAKLTASSVEATLTLQAAAKRR